MTLDDLASPEYRATLNQLHRTTRWGSGGKYHGKLVTEFARVMRAKTILDYGCGTGMLAKAVNPDLIVKEFDPGVEGKDKMPEPADLVIATDVLEHVETGRVDNVITHMRELALMGAFVIVALSPSKTVLPDGRNTHLTLRGADWWLDRLRRGRFKVLRREMMKGLWVWLM